MKEQQNVWLLPEGTVLHERYEIRKSLGKGGFGITYLGWDKVLETEVAIKEYYPDGLVGRDVSSTTGEQVRIYTGETEDDYGRGLQSFLSEARTMSKFSGLTSIVTVKDFFHANKTAYIVMEYVSGTNLRHYIQQKGKIPAKEALALLQPVLQSLSTIHSYGIIHRDISPDNLIIMNNGQMKLIDFGSARMSEPFVTKTMTRTFKRGFSAEEQYRVRGKQGTFTDVYGICATFYYMVTGKVPDESVERLVHDRLTPLTAIADIEMTDRAMTAIVKGMAVQSQDRIQNIETLYADLYGENVPEVDKPSSPKPMKRTSLVISKTEIFRELQQSKKAKQRKTAAIVIAIFVVCAALAILFLWKRNNDVALDSPIVPTTTPLATPTPTIVPTKTVKEMAGMSYEEAKAYLEQESILFTFKRKYNSSVKKNVVAAQSIVGQIGASEIVEVTISKGKKPTSPTPTPTNVPTVTPAPTAAPTKKPATKDNNSMGSLDEIFK